jgi:hypothetical protein
MILQKCFWLLKFDTQQERFNDEIARITPYPHQKTNSQSITRWFGKADNHKKLQSAEVQCQSKG